MNIEARLSRIEKETQKRVMKNRDADNTTYDFEKAFRDLHMIYGNGAPYVPPPSGLTHEVWMKHVSGVLDMVYSKSPETTVKEKSMDSKHD